MKTCSNLVKNSNVVNINMYHPLLLLIIAVLLAASAGVRPLLRSAAASPGSFPVVPSDLVSRDRPFATLQDLTLIQPYSGWRSAATQGEAEAFDYVADRLGRLAALRDWGLELERQSFEVFMSTEF